MSGPARRRAPGELAALVRRVNAVYESGAAPSRGPSLRRPALSAPQRHSLTVAALSDPGAAEARSYPALLVECRIDTPDELRALLRAVASNAAATVLHWALATPGDDGRPRWTAEEVLQVATGQVPARGAVPSGSLRGLAALDPTVFDLAAVVGPPGGERGRSVAGADDVDRLLAAVDAIYTRPPTSEAGRRWCADELHALVLADLDDVEQHRTDASYLSLLVTWGLDTPEGLRDLLRLQAAAAVRMTLRWLRRDAGDPRPVLAEAAATAWWADEPR